MRRGKWIVIAVALGLIVATAWVLVQVRGRIKLGPPGVKADPIALYGPDGMLLSNRTILLPPQVDGFGSFPIPVGEDEASALPPDTTLSRRFYTNQDMGIQTTVVLMGTDHTSIHQPQYCLFAQDWTVTDQQRIALPIERPHRYDIPAVKITASKTLTNGVTLHGLYVYWFVSGNKITAEEGARLWSQWKAVLQEGLTERWAYISYFTTCLPGEEPVAFERLQKFILATVPEFQTVTGEQSSPPANRDGK